MIYTWLLFKKEKPPAHGWHDNMIWAQGSCSIKETSNWAWAGREVPNDYVLKEKLKKPYCYNCLNLYHTQSFFPSVRYLFSHFSRPETVSWKGHTFLNLLNLSQHCYPALKNLKKTGSSHLEKVFLRQIWTIIATTYYFSPFSIIYQ